VVKKKSVLMSKIRAIRVLKKAIRIQEKKMQRFCKTRLIPLSLVPLGIIFSLFTGNSLAQNLIEIQNQVTINYNDTIGHTYSTKSNIIITPLTISGFDLWAIKEGPKEVISGGIATYTITYGNKGTQTAYGVVLCDQFPAQMQSLIYQDSGYLLSFNSITKLGTWNIDILPPGTYSFKMSMRIGKDMPGSSSVVNVIRIISPQEETYLANNYSTATTHIRIPDIDLWVIKEGPTSVTPGNIATYTIIYGNSGSETAGNVILVDKFPDQMETVLRQTSGFLFTWDNLTKCGTWNVGNVSPGTYSFKLAIKIKGNTQCPTTMTNTIKIAYPGVETNDMNNQSTATTFVTDADMDIFKYGPYWALSGQNITYTIYYRYTGNTSPGSVTIIDYLPAGIQYVSDTSSGSPTITGSGTTTNPQVVTWSSLIPTNVWQSFQVVAFVTEDAIGTLPSKLINNIVEVKCSSQETNYTNNRATSTTTIEAAQADISIYKYLWTPRAIKGYEVTYQITAYNYGNTIAGSVTITDRLPQGLKYISNTEIGSPTITGSVTSGGQILTWQIGTMAIYGYKQFLLTALITDIVSSQIDNIATISTTTQEKDNTNNRATCSTYVKEPKTDLWIYKSGPANINPAFNTLQYYISYGNYGNVPVGSVTIVDTLPSIVHYATDTSGFTATQTRNQITWFVGTVNPGYCGYFQLTLSVTGYGSTTLTNGITIYPVETGNDGNNNYAVFTTFVKPSQIDLEISKSGPSMILASDKITYTTYTIQYRNLGSVDAGSVTITDTLPVGVSYASDTSGFTPAIVTEGSHTIVIWEFGTRAMTGARNWVIFQLIGKVTPDIPTSTTLTNKVEISTRDEETKYTNNTFTLTTHILPPKADLRITKDKYKPYEVTSGCELTYRIGYNNFYGNVPATNTWIIDTLPGSVTFGSCTGNGTFTRGQVKWNIGTLTKGQNDYVYLTVWVNNDVEGTLTNIVEIISNTPDLNSSNNRATSTVLVVDRYADVSITKSAPYDIQPGQILRYRIGYSNYNGNIPATNTMIIDTLPPGVTYTTDTSGFLLTKGTNTLIWNVGTLCARSNYHYFYLTVNVNQDLKGSTTITNKIEIKTDTYEKNTTNNYAVWKTHIVPEDVDLSIEKSSVKKEVAQGDEFEYSVKCRNLSKSTAKDVKITDMLPDELIYLSDTSGIPATITNSGIIWDIGTMASRYSNAFKIRVKVKEGVLASSTVTNIIEVTTTNFDTNYINNRATCTTHICLPEPKLRIRKWQKRSDVTAGQKMDYFVRYNNDGKGKAMNVLITDILPQGVSYVSDDSGLPREVVGNKVIWQVETIAPGISDDFRLTVQVDKYVEASTTLTNVIEITSPTYQSEDRWTCTTHVVAPITDVLIYKFGHDKVLYGTEFNYEITYNNNSANDADGVVIKDILDPQLIYGTDTSGIIPIINGNEIIWDIGTMSPWASRNFLLKVFVPHSVPASTTLTNVIEITTLTQEDRYNNNRATATTYVDKPKVDVGIEKKGDDARPGFIKKYHITYYNKGTEQAEDVVIIDKLPPEVEYLSSSDGGNYNSASHTITWNIGSLPPQTNRYLTIEVRIPQTQACGINLYNYIQIKTASPESDYLNNKFTEIETVVTSIDPNDKLVSPQRYIRNNELLNYTIRFENQATATASAIFITITDQLPPELDWTTFKFEDMKLGQGTYTLENFHKGSLSCSYDVGSGTIRFEFDFKTGTNGLPPNVIPPEGEGYVNFSVRAKSGLAAGTEITNIANIRFDYNPWMETPPVTNIVDLDKPTSKVVSLEQYQTSTSFVVSWSGTDTAGNKPGEIENYTIYVSDNNGTFTKWLDEIVATSGTFTGQTGHSYKFYCVAKDRAKNIEEKIPSAEAQTSLTQIPRHFVIATLTTRGICPGGTLPLIVSIYDSEGNLDSDYMGTATLRDKLGLLGNAVFNGTHTWIGEITIPQIPNGGTNNICVQAEGVLYALSDTFPMWLDRYVGGMVTLFTPDVGTTTIRFGTLTFIQDFYIIINCVSPTNIPDGGINNSAREIIAYNAHNNNQLTGTFTNLAYLEIPYVDANQDGFVDGTMVKETTLRVYVWENSQWQEIVDSGVDAKRNVVWCNINHLSTFMPIGILVAPSTLGNVAVYPNPFKPNSDLGHEYITFGSKKELNRRLTSYATIKIYTVSGDLVKTIEVTPQDNGQKVWYADNDAGQKVASGVYIYLITNPQGEKCIGKLAIIR